MNDEHNQALKELLEALRQLRQDMEKINAIAEDVVKQNLL